MTAYDVRQLGDFLDGMEQLSRRTGVWGCTFQSDDLTLPSGEIVKINRVPKNDEVTTHYVIEGN